MPMLIGPRLVRFANGTRKLCDVFAYQGACLVGQSTAYVMKGKRAVWVKPGRSTGFVESPS